MLELLAVLVVLAACAMALLGMAPSMRASNALLGAEAALHDAISAASIRAASFGGSTLSIDSELITISTPNRAPEVIRLSQGWSCAMRRVDDDRLITLMRFDANGQCENALLVLRSPDGSTSRQYLLHGCSLQFSAIEERGDTYARK